jgi:hypothetical protein
MMIAYGISFMLMRVYSGSFGDVMRLKYDMLIVMNLAHLVKTTLLKSSLAKSMSAVEVATVPG